MKLLKRILFIIGIIVLLIAAVGLLFFPSHIHVQRSTLVRAPQKDVFAYMQDFRNWNKWSPWFEMDPKAVYTYEGAPTGAGAVMKWESMVKEVGKGSMTITEVKPDSVIRIDLNFMENGVAKSSLMFSPAGDETSVTWNFDVEAGANPLLRIMGSFMDDFIGKEYEKGLSNLKTRLEAKELP